MSDDRHHLLAAAFSDLKSEIAGIPLRPLSAGSYVLLGTLRNSLVGAREGGGQVELIADVIQYAWVHSAPIAEVAAVQKPEDLPAARLIELGFEIPYTECFAFMRSFQDCALRLAAALTAPDDEAEVEPGKLVPLPTGSPRSSSPAELPEIPFGSDTSSGKCPSSAPSPTSTPPVSPTEAPSAGPALLVVMDDQEETPSSPSPSSASAG